MPLVAVVLGSRSDMEAIEPCLKTLAELGIEYELQVMSAHRTPGKVQEFASAAEASGFEVIIAAAGMAAHLPGVIASWTALPVIGVPVGSADTAGLDALLSIVQMPPGVPVGCMAVNGARNAALYAARILAIKHTDVKLALEAYREKLAAGLPTTNCATLSPSRTVCGPLYGSTYMVTRSSPR